MEKNQKKRIKSIISWCCIAVLVVSLAVMPLIAAQNAEEEGPEVVVRSAEAETGVLRQALHAGGTLSAQDSVELTIPSGVKLTSFLVKNGDTVQAGDALAGVDTVTVMEAIAQVQETLDYLDEQIDSIDEGSGTTRLTAQTAGTVKTIYAQKGDNVQQVMVEYGALMILSLDGKMAVDVESQENLPVGTSLSVILATGETVTGRVESRLGNTYIVTVSDDGYAMDTAATVATEDGVVLGSGNLYIYNPWRVTAVSGTVSNINVSENTTVTQGKQLLTLTETDTDAQQQVLLGQRQDYEETMQTLFQMYRSGTLNAPCDGVVTGIDEDSPLLLSAQEDGFTVMQLSNVEEPEPEPEPDPEPEPEPQPATYTGVVALIAAGEDGSLEFLTDMERITISDPRQVNADVSALTIPYDFSGGMYLYVISQGELQLTATQAAAGQLVFITDGEKLISLGSISTGSDNGSGNVPGSSTLPGDISGMISGGVSGFAGMGGVTVTPSFEPYDLTETTVLTVTPQDTLTLAVPVDEQDIRNIHLGMEATVTVTALGSESYAAQVTEIGTAVNSGGNSKFTVTLTLEKGEKMLAGMSASAILPLNEEVEGLLIPTAAIYDDGTNVFVYTALDAKTGEPTNPVNVTIGLSDGEYTQILSGLEAGQQVFFTYYEAQ